MKYISLLIKPASSLCNIRCRYCFYFDVANQRQIASYNFMKEDTMQALVDRALAIDEELNLTFVFQGGEPLLAGLAFYRFFIDYVDKQRTKQAIHYTIQTNGTLLNEDWCVFFKRHHFLVGISLDAYQANHDNMRQSLHYQGTYDKVMHAIDLLKTYGIEFNILTVLTNSLAKHPHKVFEFYLSNELNYVQFIPCLPSLGNKKDANALKPKEFASFYIQLFDCFKNALLHEQLLSINLFDNLLLLLQGKYPFQCGMLGTCNVQYVIEANGDVYPCDFYCLDEYRLGNIHQDSFKSMSQTKAMQDFLREPRRDCKQCLDCPFKKLCHKNCKRLNITYYDEDFCGYRLFLEYAIADLQEIAYLIQE